MNAATPEPEAIHYCFSGETSCSGCNPCNACAERVENEVLPMGIVAAGQGGALLQLVHVFAGALENLGYDAVQIGVQECGVSLEDVFQTSEDQLLAFRVGYREGFSRHVHAIMGDNPAVASLVTRTPVRGGQPMVAAPETEPEAVEQVIPPGTSPPFSPVGRGATPVEGDDPLKAMSAFMAGAQRRSGVLAPTNTPDLAVTRAQPTVPAEPEPSVAVTLIDDRMDQVSSSPAFTAVDGGVQPLTVDGGVEPLAAYPIVVRQAPPAVVEAELSSQVEDVKRVLTKADVAELGHVVEEESADLNGMAQGNPS